jgi:hypothetical protein
LKEYYSTKIVERFESSTKKNLDIAEWATAHKAMLSLYIMPDDIDMMTTAMAQDTKPCLRGLRRVLATSEVGRRVFADEGRKANYELFISNCDDRIRTLEYNSFVVDEYESFRELTLREAKAVRPAGKLAHDKPTTINFLGDTQDMSLACTQDVGIVKLKARVKTIAVNSGQCSMLPWERLVLAKGSITQNAETIVVPAAILDPLLFARKALLRLLGAERLTLKEMRKIFSSNVTELYEIEPSISLEYEYLATKMEAKINGRVEADGLDCLPLDGQKFQISKACDVIGTLILNKPFIQHMYNNS